MEDRERYLKTEASRGMAVTLQPLRRLAESRGNVPCVAMMRSFRVVKRKPLFIIRMHAHMDAMRCDYALAISYIGYS